MKKLLIAALMALSLTGCIENGTGEKIGVITKIAKQGFFCPTWEAEIIRGGFSGGSGVNGASFHFTVNSDAEAKLITEAMEGQKEVKIHYRSEVFTFCRTESGHFMTELGIVDNKPKQEPSAVGEVKAGANKDVIVRLLQVQAELLKELAK